MAVLITADLPTGSADEDREMVASLGLERGAFAELRWRLAGPTDNGGWRVVALWETREAFEAFRDGPLAAALLEHGRSVPTFTLWEPEIVTPAQ
jgi:hypothetical protein